MKRATIKNKEHIIEILTKSFQNNLSVQYVAEKSSKQIRRLIEYSFFQALHFGMVFISNDNKACCLLLESNKKNSTIHILGYKTHFFSNWN